MTLHRQPCRGSAQAALLGMLPGICTPSSSLRCGGQAAMQRLGMRQISSLTD